MLIYKCRGIKHHESSGLHEATNLLIRFHHIDTVFESLFSLTW